MTTKAWERMIAARDRQERRARERERQERRKYLALALAMTNEELLDTCLYDYEADPQFDRVLRRRLRQCGFLPSLIR